jgi:hypothetical protein
MENQGRSFGFTSPIAMKNSSSLNMLELLLGLEGAAAH